VVIRPDDLALVDLPEDAFFLAKILTIKPLVLPDISIPVLIRVEIRSIILLNSREVDKRTILSMAVCINVAARLQGANITIPRFCLSIPPVLAQPFGFRDRMGTSCVDRYLCYSSTKEVVFEVGPMVQQEKQDTWILSVGEVQMQLF